MTTLVALVTCVVRAINDNVETLRNVKGGTEYQTLLSLYPEMRNRGSDGHKKVFCSKIV